MEPSGLNYLGVLTALALFVIGWAMTRDWLWRTDHSSNHQTPLLSHLPHKILVPVADKTSSEREIEILRLLRKDDGAEVFLLHVIEVPQTLPLHAGLPGEEEKAEEIIARAEALAAMQGMEAFSEVRRGRVVSEEIIKAAKDWGADMILMSVHHRRRFLSSLFGRTSERVRHEAACEVVAEDFGNQTAASAA